MITGTNQHPFSISLSVTGDDVWRGNASGSRHSITNERRVL